MFTLQYVHCIKFTKGQLDVAPYTQYEWRSVECQMYRVAPDWRLGETEDSFEVETIDGRKIGWGDTKEDAISDARYRLMDESRTAAEKAATNNWAIEKAKTIMDDYFRKTITKGIYRFAE